MNRDYEAYWSSLGASHARHPANRYRYRLVAGELTRLKLEPERVVDCGCGDGSLLAVVARNIPCGELYGIDVASGVPLARSAFPIGFRQHDLGEPIPEALHGQFDLVLCSEVIEHVPQDQTVLENMYKLARQGGYVVLTTQSGRIYRTEQFLGHLRHYQLSDLSRRMEDAGLKILKSYRCGWPFLNLQKIIAHAFQGTVQKRIVQRERLSVAIRAVFLALELLYRLSSRRRGPQIFILARKG